MRRISGILSLLLLFSLIHLTALRAQIKEDQLGAWYIYTWKKDLQPGKFGVKGDIQFRNWDFGSDLQQLLLRTGFYYHIPETDVQLTQGYAYIVSGPYGEGGDNTDEHRVFQEVLLPQKVGQRVMLQHRFRLEERWLEGQDFRTRWRYAFGVNIPLNGTAIEKGTAYLAFYDELFINGQRDIGNDRTVTLFAQNRLYGALGYGLTPRLHVQVGYMKLMTESWNKGQMQFSLHHTW